MKKTLKTITLSLLIALVAVTLSTGIVLAYFNLSNRHDLGVSIASTSRTVSITTESELLKYSRDDAFSQSEEISSLDGGNRYTLVLANDLTLTQNVFITADIHLDLGGYTLYLGDKSLTIEQPYSGTMAISNGTLSNAIISTSQAGDVTTTYGEGKLFVYAPNSVVLIEGVVGDFIVDITESEQAMIDKYLAYTSLYNVAKSLISVFDYTAPKLTFAEVNDASVDLSNEALYFNSAYGYYINYTKNLVLTTLDLPLRTFNDDNISFSYSSSDVSRITNDGEFISSTTSSDVDLTATVKVGETEYSTVFKLNVAGTSSLADESVKILKTYLSPYYKVGSVPSTDGGGTVEVTAYFLTGDISLPRIISLFDGEATFTYQAKTSADGLLSNIITTSDFDVNSLVLSPTSNIAKVDVSCVYGSSSVSETLPMYFLDSDTTNVRTNESIAREIINVWYGSSITITLDENSQSYSSKELVTENLTKFGVENIKYVLLNNPDGTYELVDIDPSGTDFGQRLQVVATNPVLPNLTQTVMLSVEVELAMNTAVTGNTEDAPASARTVTLYVPVRYSVEAADSTNVSGFLPYYNYFNSIFESRTVLSTANSFNMPLFYGTGRPVISLTFESASEQALSAISYQIVYNGSTANIAKTSETFTDDEGNTMYRITAHTGLDGYISGDSSVTIASLVAANATWHINIDKSLLSNQNTNVSLNYHYKTVNDSSWGDGGWTRYTNSINWNLCGVLSTTDMPDAALYEWVYVHYSMTDTVYDAGVDFIFVDWLMQDITISGLSGVSNLTGIEYLNGVRIADFSGLSLSSQYLVNISQMDSLTSLNLSSCTLTDRNSGAVDATLTKNFEALKDAKALTTLYLSNNTIYSFAFLSQITTLQTVYVDQQNISGVNTVFYGSGGLANYDTYVTLSNRGVSVYAAYAAGTPLLFSNSSAGTTYSALTNIIYQERLQNGVSITKVYENLSVETADYGLPTTVTDLTGDITYTVTSQTIEFGYYEDEFTTSEFYLRFTIVVSSQTFSMDLTFSVKRV